MSVKCFGSRKSHKLRVVKPQGDWGVVRFGISCGLMALKPKQKALMFKCLVVYCMKWVPVRSLSGEECVVLQTAQVLKSKT